MRCEKTMYNYIDACLFDIRNIDLSRKVRFRERYKKPEFKVDKSCRVGRNYESFEKFLEKSPDISIVQMDSVIGSKGEKCLLTTHFVDSSFMLAFLRDANTSTFVTDIFSFLYGLLGDWSFKSLFPAIHTDNGIEFSNPKALTQEDTHLMMNHINSYKRKKLNNRSAYETFSFYHGVEVLHRLGCEPVASGAIMLKPALLKK